MAKQFIFLLIAMTGAFLKAEEFAHAQERSPHDEDAIAFHGDLRQSSDNKQGKTVWFRYKDEPLINMVNDLAAQRGINIMLPQGPNALTAKLTFELPHKISLDRAWQHMITILDIAGFTIVPHKEFSFVVKNDKNVNRETLPLYIGVAPHELPNTDLKIRYLRYLSYLQVPGAGGGGGSSSLQDLFNQLLSSGSAVIYEPQLNAVLITDTARNIKSVMTIVDELDASSTGQHAEFVKLKHTSAGQVKALFDQLIPGSGSSSSGGISPQVGTGSGYFSKGTIIVAEERLNTLILLGKQEALERIVDFIEQYVDVPPENGKSVLHVYNLQYLKAEDFASILSQIVQNQSSSSSSQSTSSGGGQVEQYFKGVIITPETGSGGGYGSGSSVAGGSQSGNRLIVAALRDDWIRIEQLIKELDKPQLQVLIHGLVVDLSYTALKDFANQVRNYKDLFFKDVNWQTGHIAGIETETTSSSTSPTNSNALMANLLPSGNTSSGYSSGNIAGNATAGSFILSFKDPGTNGIWWISTILSSHTDSKILSQPFLMTMNNKQVKFVDGEERRIPGEASQQFGVEVANKTDVEAKIDLTILPRINQNGTINLSIQADISQFTGTDNAKDTRNVVTNVNLHDKDILILGGLSKTKVEHTVYKTPLIGDIPLVGNLFKKRTDIVTKSNLMIFLRPEIIRPSENHVTERYFKKAGKILESKEENFVGLRDPITRFFFGKEPKEISPRALKEFRREIEPIEVRLQKSGAPALPVPQPRKLQEAALPTTELTETSKPTLSRPSERSGVNQLQEEHEAAQELQRLFGWAKEEEFVDRNHPPTTEHDTLTPFDFSEKEEERARQDLEKILADPEFEKLFVAKDQAATL